MGPDRSCRRRQLVPGRSCLPVREDLWAGHLRAPSTLLVVPECLLNGIPASDMGLRRTAAPAHNVSLVSTVPNRVVPACSTRNGKAASTMDRRKSASRTRACRCAPHNLAWVWVCLRVHVQEWVRAGPVVQDRHILHPALLPSLRWTACGRCLQIRLCLDGRP